MKLSNRKQLLSEADAELKRMRKLAGLTEGKKPLLIEEFMEGTDALIAAVNAILDGLLILTKRGVDTDGTPLPTTFDREKAIKIITKHQNNIISKIKSNQMNYGNQENSGWSRLQEWGYALHRWAKGA